MTNPSNPTPSDQVQPVSNSTAPRASYRKSIAPEGSNALAPPAPGAAGTDRPRGAPVVRDATEGGSHPEGEKQHTCHSVRCTHAATSKPHVQQRERLHNENKRMRQPSCRMNEDEYQLLVRAASACSMSVASFLAHAVLKAARDLDRTAAEVATKREVINELFSVRRHLGQIGNNLNQVAKATNSGADVPHTEAVLEAVRRAARRIEAFTQHYLESEAHAL
ncbi:MobC family plasmid mobilization relaxosome protein [Streptomyces sp. WAC 06783]|uniref:MobC family plasmid mobilization relaxosome protein n=1 Tax=Streptomyces sp. WAC 06783 TaxID=2203211 RepID=UPI0021ADD760|nr:MobC family plasmid mobilization relaxosome protein [Streptomyces sp. WAC 06783]